MNKNTDLQCYDVLVVGSGVAGMYGAMQFDKSISVCMLSKYGKTVSNSNLAQGGVACVLDFEDDSFDLHIKDTMIAGRNANNPDAVKILVEEGPDDVRHMMEYGVTFDCNINGKLDKTLEGGHSRRRIVHYKDRTGAALVETLLGRVEQRENITYLENTALANLVRVPGGFRADILRDGELFSVYCLYCMLCTGGIGKVYKYTTNPKSATGDGIRFAFELGAEIRNLSYVQFHPTAFDSESGEQFLISESVRGEGAVLLNYKGERFMHRYDERLELAPRDVVSHAILEEEKRTGDSHFYLDITHEDADFIRNRFPAVYEGCMRNGVDMTKDRIPVYPCQHYLMGGIGVDEYARTTVPGLYACGECANTGVHGKNRLASNSLLEALVFSRRAAEDIQKKMKANHTLVAVEPVQLSVDGKPMPDGIVAKIRTVMQKAAFVTPDIEAVREGLVVIQAIVDDLQNGGYAVTNEYMEAKSLAKVALIILKELSES